MRSRQTGQVGSSMSAGVGGAIGFVVSVLLSDVSALELMPVIDAGCVDGKKGSLFMLGKLVGFSDWSDT